MKCTYLFRSGDIQEISDSSYSAGGIVVHVLILEEKVRFRLLLQ
jgi:hypothetical protein